LRRLNLVDGPNLSEEDDAALGRIADEANPAEQQRRSAR
jgi:hypothetical protein